MRSTAIYYDAKYDHQDSDRMLLLTATLSSEQKMFEPRFSGDNQLARPEGYGNGCSSARI